MMGSIRLLAVDAHKGAHEPGTPKRVTVKALEKVEGGFPARAGLDMHMHSRTAFLSKVVRSGLGSVFQHRSLAALEGAACPHPR